jgi:hypothetical protein
MNTLAEINITRALVDTMTRDDLVAFISSLPIQKDGKGKTVRKPNSKRTTDENLRRFINDRMDARRAELIDDRNYEEITHELNGDLLSVIIPSDLFEPSTIFDILALIPPQWTNISVAMKITNCPDTFKYGNINGLDSAKWAKKAYDLFRALFDLYADAKAFLITISPVQTTPSSRLSMARFNIANGKCCLITAIAAHKARNGESKNTPQLMKKIFAVLPHLKPSKNEDARVFATHKDLAVVSDILKQHIVVYSSIGERTGTVWMEFGKSYHAKMINIKVSSQHCNLMSSSIDIAKVNYDNWMDSFDSCAVAKDYISREGRLTGYCVLDEDNTITMHKGFRPSELTKNPADDLLPEYFTTMDMHSMFYKLMARHYNIKPTCNYVDLIKSSEVFVGRGILQRVHSTTYECDHNSSYLSGKYCDYYMGYPTGTMQAIKGEPLSVQECKKKGYDMLPMFVLIGENSSWNPEVEKLYSMLTKSTSLSILSYPEWQFFTGKGCKFNVHTTIYAVPFDLDIADFATRFASSVEASELKVLRLGAVGRLISGGMASEFTKTYWDCSVEEMTQLKFECANNGFPFCIETNRDNLFDITVKCKTSNSGSYHIHSFILAYSRIQMMEAMIKLAKYDIVAFNVDSITTLREPADDALDFGSRPGMWKKLPGKKLSTHYTKMLEQAAGKEVEIVVDNTIIPAGVIPHSKIVINGPGGIGKSYPFIANPPTGSCLTVPTHLLLNAHINTGKELNQGFPACTSSLYFGLNTKIEMARKMSVKRKIGGIKPIVIADEFSLLSSAEWKIAVDRCREDSSAIIALGDFEQVQKGIGSDPVNRQWFEEEGFIVLEQRRKLDSPARHLYEYGCFLDTLRGLSVDDQKDVLADVLPVEFGLTLRESMHVITGSHQRAHFINNMGRSMLKKIPLRRVNKCKDKGQITWVNKEEIGDNVFWDRKSVKCSAPPGTLYEPAVALTCDCVQGMTMRGITVGIDCDGLHRHGSIYTAVTRAEYQHQNVLLVLDAAGQCE